MNTLLYLLSTLVLLACTSPALGRQDTAPTRGSVIFIHPDGTGLAHWGLARVAHVGPDGELAWDRLPEIGIYRPHMRDSLAPSSHSGRIFIILRMLVPGGIDHCLACH